MEFYPTFGSSVTGNALYLSGDLLLLLYATPYDQVEVALDPLVNRDDAAQAAPFRSC
jgi:hypothetical protein